MKSYNHLDFVTPPRHQGQIVEISYAVDSDWEEIVQRAYDHSDGTVSYSVAPLENLVGDFEPQNRSPVVHGQWSVGVVRSA